MSLTTKFLSSISQFLHTKDAASLADFLRVEPPLPQTYWELSQELKQGIDIEKAVDSIDNDDAWPGFLAFLKEYLEFWRDVNFEDLLETYFQLSGLVNACITAFSNSTYGIVVLPTTISLSAALAKLAVTLDKRPDLTRRLKLSTEGGESRKTLVEGTAESIQRAFTMCLTERTANRNGIGKDGRPESKKIGIYSFANMVLKLLFQCHKTRLANQLFTNISQHSPPLQLYPASQRVTYLYYLGRFLFSNTHYYKASLCLQSAYDQCHIQCLSQRRLILTYLLASNLILGRFPSREFLNRPEANGLIQRFAPLALAMKQGNLAAFKRLLSSKGRNYNWFFTKGILLPLLYRGQLIVWRSLARKVFLMTYVVPSDPKSRKAPTLDLTYLLLAAQFTQFLAERLKQPSCLRRVGISRLQFRNTPRRLPPSQGVVLGNNPVDYATVECVVASLVSQGLLRGFVSHSLQRFAILGAKQRGGPLNAGFPPPYEVIRARAEKNREDEVPGWVRKERMVGMGGVVNLTGIARPVGSGGM